MHPLARAAIGAAAVAAALGGAWWWRAVLEDGPPPGFARSNGRIEVTRVDVASRFPGRLAEVLVDEGDRTAPGQVVARLDDAQLRAQLNEAEAMRAQAEQALIEAQALARQRASELEFQNQELLRTLALNARGHASQEAVDLARTRREAAAAAVDLARASVGRARAAIDAAAATVARIKADLADYALVSPVQGRVQHRLAEPGEVIPAGGRVLTLLDLTDVYMNVYLPAPQAAALRVGAEARIVPEATARVVIPATVAFVDSQAQFTPKYVETESERAKLMFRVKLTVAPEIAAPRIDLVKAGVPAEGWVRLDSAAPWPPELAPRLPDPVR
ncbi:HlyD family secretion protein [Oceanicella actignis]|uniref:HlyD family secretion protein n=1 Tax=Oceanicella actignis TaxID=1189325 RepID=A0A1M7TMW3_9RHOB|nr:HlyD family efflux transporter periplasmic adaptor subunit [Oceanicella actignis]SET71913.1 HlyD family secretion protein [Oceanicella actignis]SHN72082.1 HlyD family secretion protein [Oceanicella actignis]